MADVIADIVAFFVHLLSPYTQIPLSTFFVLGVAVMLALASATAGKLLVDYDMVKSTQREFQAWRKEMDKAKKANDQQTLSKLMKKQQTMTKLQARGSMEQMKVTAVTFVPFVLLWYLLNAVFGHAVVAISPFPLPIAGTQMSFVYWYFLSSFAVNLPIMRLFGIGMSDN